MLCTPGIFHQKEGHLIVFEAVQTEACPVARAVDAGESCCGNCSQSGDWRASHPCAQYISLFSLRSPVRLQSHAPLVGNKAPDFTATAVVDQEFKTIKLSDYKGKK